MLLIFSMILNKENRSTLEALYKEYSSMMYKVAKSILNDEYLAQDAIQEAFINIYKNFDKIIQIDCNKRRALFVIIIRNVSIDLYRSRKKETNVSLEDISDGISELVDNIDEMLIIQETFNKVADALNDLNPAYADILSLKLFYQYDDEEISKLLNITPENTRTRLHRARKNLIKLLSQEKEGENRE